MPPESAALFRSMTGIRFHATYIAEQKMPKDIRLNRTRVPPPMNLPLPSISATSRRVPSDITLSASTVTTIPPCDARTPALRTCAMQRASFCTTTAPKLSAISTVRSVQRFAATTISTPPGVPPDPSPGPTSLTSDRAAAARFTASMHDGRYFSSLCAGITTEMIGWLFITDDSS